MLNDNRSRIILGIALLFLLAILTNPTGFYGLLGVIQSIAIIAACTTITIYLIRKM